MTADDRKLAEEKIETMLSAVERQCGKQKTEFDPGTLGKRRFAYCINEGLKKVLLRLQHQSAN